MKAVFARVLGGLVLLAASTFALAADAVNPAELKAGDEVAIEGSGGQSYAVRVLSVKDGVLHARCLRSGSEFRGELSAISAVRTLDETPQQDMAGLLTLMAAGADSKKNAARSGDLNPEAAAD